MVMDQPNPQPLGLLRVPGRRLLSIAPARLALLFALRIAAGLEIGPRHRRAAIVAYRARPRRSLPIIARVARLALIEVLNGDQHRRRGGFSNSVEADDDGWHLSRSNVVTVQHAQAHGRDHRAELRGKLVTLIELADEQYRAQQLADFEQTRAGIRIVLSDLGSGNGT